MGPAIGRSIGQGFRTANRSWVGIGFLAGVWVIAWLLVSVLVVLTRVPRELFRPPQATQQVVAPERAAPDTSPTPQDQQAAAAREAEDRWVRTAGEWFTRAWPVLLIALLLLLATSLWLQGGQIGYVAELLRAQRSKLSTFWIVGSRAFLPLLGGWLMTVLIVVGLALAGGLVVALFGWLDNVAPDWLNTVLGLLVVGAAAAGTIWLGITLVFWYIAIVLDQLGPIRGLKASFRATRGRWWKLFGLLILLVLLSLGVQLAFGLLERLGNAIGGNAATVIAIASNITGVLATLYLGFVMTAAFVTFYEDVKASSAVAVPAGTAS